ncbi:putative reverse transcriptase domain-containing protein [Tanacetum coccineum]
MIENHWMDKLLKEVLMIDELSIVETDKVNHTVEMDMLKLVVEVECFGKCVDEFDKVTVLFGEMQLKQEDRSYVHASNELHLHVVHVVPSKHEADQHSPAASVPLSLPIPRALSFARADLLPSPKTTRSPELATDLEVSLAESSEPSRYRGTDLEMDVDVERSDGLILTSRFRFIVEAIDLEEIETGARGPVEVRVNRVTHPVIVDDIPKPTQEEGAVEVTYNTLGDLVKRFHDHTEEIPVHRVQAIKRALGARDAARNLEPLIGDESEQEEVNGNGGNGNGGNGNGGKGNRGNGNRVNGNGGNGNGGGNSYNFEGFMPARDALTWWNSHKRTTRIEAAYAMSWAELMKLMTEVYYLRNEIQKIETELWNLAVKGNDLTAYIRRFQELVLLCTRMVPNEEDKVERFVGGLPDNIQGNVIAAEPTKL